MVKGRRTLSRFYRGYNEQDDEKTGKKKYWAQFTHLCFFILSPLALLPNSTARPQSAAAPSSVSLSPSRCDVASQLTAPKMTFIASVRARSSTASISVPRGSLGVEDARAGGAAQRIGASAGQWRAAADGTPASWGWRTRVMGGSSGRGWMLRDRQA
jgi:hypothetical protein